MKMPVFSSKMRQAVAQRDTYRTVIRAGDLVRHYSRGFMCDPDDDWMMFGSGIGPLRVVSVAPSSEAWSDDGGRTWDTARGPAYLRVVCALPPPHDQETHYQYFDVRPTKRWWQYRAQGCALDIVDRDPDASSFAQPSPIARGALVQMDLFA